MARRFPTQPTNCPMWAIWNQYWADRLTGHIFNVCNYLFWRKPGTFTRAYVLLSRGGSLVGPPWNRLASLNWPLFIVIRATCLLAASPTTAHLFVTEPATPHVGDLETLKLNISLSRSKLQLPQFKHLAILIPHRPPWAENRNTRPSARSRSRFHKPEFPKQFKVTCLRPPC